MREELKALRLARLADGPEGRRSLAARTALLAQLLEESTRAPPANKPARTAGAARNPFPQPFTRRDETR